MTDALAVSCGVAGFIVGLIVGVLGTVKVFLIMHKNSING